jgi:hypothetical protein
MFKDLPDARNITLCNHHLSGNSHQEKQLSVPVAGCDAPNELSGAEQATLGGPPVSHLGRQSQHQEPVLQHSQGRWQIQAL